MILKLKKLLCFIGLHRYKTINIEFGFNPTDRITTLRCKNCEHTKLKAGGENLIK
jgi:hypothetical protein